MNSRNMSVKTSVFTSSVSAQIFGRPRYVFLNEYKLKSWGDPSENVVFNAKHYVCFDQHVCLFSKFCSKTCCFFAVNACEKITRTIVEHILCSSMFNIIL